MSQVSTRKKTEDEIIAEAYFAFRAEHGPGPIPLSGIVGRIFDKQMWEAPTEKQLRRQCLSKVARYMKKLRVRDRQNRLVRAMHPAKYPTLGGGQTIMWDDHFEMSFEHGMKSFTTRAALVQKSRKALERDLGSFIDNNPNAAGHVVQLEFLFEFVSQESTAAPKVEEIPPDDGFRKLPR